MPMYYPEWSKHTIEESVDATLKMECEDYEKVQGDAGVDYLAMLELVKDHLEKKGQTLLTKKAKKAGRPMLAIYCGAIHNDAKPEEIWESVSTLLKLIFIHAVIYADVGTKTTNSAGYSATCRHQPHTDYSFQPSTASVVEGYMEENERYSK